MLTLPLWIISFLLFLVASVLGFLSIHYKEEQDGDFYKDAVTMAVASCIVAGVAMWID